MTELEAVIKARELLSTLTPLRRDCGNLCAAACCQSDEDDQGGMLLFPSEEQLYAQNDRFTLTRDDSVLPGMTLLTCDGACDRDERPLSCRIFPLTPVIETRDGREVLRVCVDPRAFAVCPLCESGVRSMDARFVDAVRQCAKLLSACDAHRQYFRALGAYFERLRNWEENA